MQTPLEPGTLNQPIVALLSLTLAYSANLNSFYSIWNLLYNNNPLFHGLVNTAIRLATAAIL